MRRGIEFIYGPPIDVKGTSASISPPTRTTLVLPSTRRHPGPRPRGRSWLFSRRSPSHPARKIKVRRPASSHRILRPSHRRRTRLFLKLLSHFRVHCTKALASHSSYKSPEKINCGEGDALFSISLGIPNVNPNATRASRIMGFLRSDRGETFSKPMQR